MPVFQRDGGPPVVVGHRGVRRAGVVENTPPAFAAAHAEGARWVELDARRSADGVAVVHHDGWTPDGLPVVEQTAATLAGKGLWALADVLAGLHPDLGVNVEVKNLPGEPDYDPDEAIAAVVADVLGEGQRPLLASSFNPLTVAALNARLPATPVALVHYDAIPVADAIPLAAEFGAVALSSRIGAAGLDAAGVAAAHAAGLEVMVWTVNDPATALAMAGAGVDAICTDDPRSLVEAFGAMPRG